MGFFASLTGKRSKPSTAASPQAKEKSTYRGVQVHANGAHCCAAIRALTGKRFLSHEVPKLPLSNCDSGDCRCTYKLFDDRRTDVRRASDLAFDIVSQFREDDRRDDDATGRRLGD